MMTSWSTDNVAGEFDFLVRIQTGCDGEVICIFGVAVICGMIWFRKAMERVPRQETDNFD